MSNAALTEQQSTPYVLAAAPQAQLRDFINAGLIPRSDQNWLEALAKYEAEARKQPQPEVETSHVFHAGMYARTVHMPAGFCFTSVLVKIPTLVIVSGHCYVFTGSDQMAEVRDHKVFAGGAMRKTMYASYSPASITMVFATKATTVEEAEAEFTDESETLLSKRSPNTVLTTGD